MHRRGRVVLLVWFLLASVCLVHAEASPWEQALDFEAAGLWKTEADLLDNGFTEDDLALPDDVTLAEQAGGMELSDAYVQSGTYAGRWYNHPYYPTLSTTAIAGDWSAYNQLSFWVYSRVATDETVSLTLYSDSDVTAWRDFYVYDFTIDFTGWRHLIIPFSDFLAYEQPAGFAKIDRVSFHTKLFYAQPNPYTDLYLDNMALSWDDSLPQADNHPYVEPDAAGRAIPYDGAVLNHGYPELAEEGAGKSPIQYQPYYKTERALAGYYPRFQPGPVSFDPAGTPYVKYGDTNIQTVDSNGTWTYIDILPVVERYLLEERGYKDYLLLDEGFYNESVIRFDREGGAYLMVTASVITQYDRENIITILLYSDDGMQTFSCYLLPTAFARFERVDGNNSECLDRPPVILLSNMWASEDQAGYILIPEKTEEGLVLPEPVQYAESCLSTAVHSGDSNFAITHDGKVYIIYGVLEPEHCPPVPESHPAKDMTFSYQGSTVRLADGVPTFVVAYDIAERTVSEPVFVGFGGHALDNHNWPALTIDSTGRLHAVINGHHNPFYYVHTEQPGDITAWSDPLLVGSASTYASIAMDREDTLYVITRDSSRGYRFDLTVVRRTKDGLWSAFEPLVQRFAPYYESWNNRVSIHPETGQLFVSYFSQSRQFEIFKDEYDANLFIFPDREKLFWEQVPDRVPTGTMYTDVREKIMYQPKPAEPVLLTADKGGTNWRVATTFDLMPDRDGLRIAKPIFWRDGVPVEMLSGAGEYTAKLTAAGNEQQLTVVAAVKGADGALLACTVEPVPAGGGEVSLAVSVPDGADRIEVYIWEDLQTMRPVWDVFTWDSMGGRYGS